MLFSILLGSKRDGWYQGVMKQYAADGSPVVPDRHQKVIGAGIIVQLVALNYKT